MISDLAYSQLLQNFHFLRPWWALLIPILWLLLSNKNSKKNEDQQAKKVFAQHIYQELTAEAGSIRKISPSIVAWVVMLLITVILMGPSWQRQPSPFLQDSSALFILLDTSNSMNSVDIQPSRLERAKQKVSDLLAERPEGYTSLIVYSGSAHSILPLTNDHNILRNYLSAVTTKIMPQQGKSVANALTLIKQATISDDTPVTVLLITDDITEQSQQALTRFSEQHRYQMLIYGIGSTNEELSAKGLTLPSLNNQKLSRISDEIDGFYLSATINKQDIHKLVSRIKSFYNPINDKHIPWVDSGYWLVFPAMLLYLLWFRRGWTIRWSSFIVVLCLSLPSTQGQAAENSFANFWLTPNQQGQLYFYLKDYKTAAERFENTMWKATSYYLNEDFDLAIEYFSRIDSNDAKLRLANAYAHAEKYYAAESIYQSLLAVFPNNQAIIENLAAVQKIIKARESLSEHQKQEQNERSDDETSDQFKQAKGKQIKTNQRKQEVQQYSAEQILKNEQLAKMWMENLQKNPSKFLANKLQIQVNKQKLLGSSNE